MTMLKTKADPMLVSMGPHHPSMHGVLRLIVTLDGENVVDCEPISGLFAPWEWKRSQKIGLHCNIFLM
jgi:NADH:ubiquinone oxidoreductase subunit D